ncbi:uncharacterized protein UHOD_11930 [Ustilago sp. UG-2017b]|nr:uncharacterized protein UHOD_11930 [Ustilago sp. UG-2017b]
MFRGGGGGIPASLHTALSFLAFSTPLFLFVLQRSSELVHVTSAELHDIAYKNALKSRDTGEEKRLAWIEQHQKEWLYWLGLDSSAKRIDELVCGGASRRHI